MITLRPPFRAENMEGLYNKVIKGKKSKIKNNNNNNNNIGQYSKISERYSKDLHEIVRLLIQVQPENRPNCGKKKFH